MNGRDSKIHVTDYDVGGTNLLYSTAEIFTWKKFTAKTVLILYGGPGELHEAAIKSTSSPVTIEGSGVTTKSASGTVTLQWTTTSTRRIVQLGTLYIYILGRIFTLLLESFKVNTYFRSELCIQLLGS